jgi:hypothetical protein
MSYVLLCYLVDIPKLSSLVGSKDAAVVDEIVESDPDLFDEDEEDKDDDELTRRVALRQLIMGEKKDPEEAHEYGYALKTICDCYGKQQDCEAWGGVRWEAVEACGLEPLMKSSGPPVTLPENSDFPRIGHIRRDEIGQSLQSARGRLERSENPEIQELLEEYIGWLETTVEEEQDAVFFYH